MPLILDPGAYSLATLESLVRELDESLRELRSTVETPHGRVLQPAGLEAARELLGAALLRMEPPAAGDRGRLAAQANLGYATMIAVIDLVKSHTDVPQVPRPRPVRPRPRSRGGRRPRVRRGTTP